MSGFSRFLDWVSEYLAQRKGLLPMLAILLVLLNFVFSLLPALGFLATSNLFLHLGVILGLFGLMLARAL